MRSFIRPAFIELQFFAGHQGSEMDKTVPALKGLMVHEDR